MPSEDADCLTDAQAVRVHTESELQAALNNLLENDALRSDIGTAGRAHVLAYHSLAVVTHEIGPN